MILNKANNFWQQFWFQEQPVTPIALFRIFFGLFVLQVSLIELAPNFLRFFGVKGLIDSATVCTYWWQSVPIFDIFLLLPQKDIYRCAFFCIFIIAAIFLTIGFRTRLSTIIVYLGLLTLDRQCPFILDGGDDFMRVLAFLLIFSPAGQAYSIDRVLQARKQGCKLSVLAPVMVSPWVQRMIQVQISLAYLHAFLAKIVGPQWQAGTAVYYVSQLVDFAKFPLPWLTNHYPGYQILTYYTLFAEFAMATLVWIKPLRYWILLAAALLHAGIDWTMNLPCFEWLFICSYINFVEPADLERILQRCQNILTRLLPTILPFQKETKQIEPKIIHSYSFSFLPTLLLLIAILVFGSMAANPLRKNFLTKEIRRNYQQRLAKTEYLWANRLNQIASMPENGEEKLTAQEALAVVLSLKKKYAKAGSLLRNVCQKRIEQNKSYNAELIRALSTLANIYLETGHIEACELCYLTILNYDNTHLPSDTSGNRLGTDLNNLGIVYYFRALLDKNKSEHISDLLKADTFFRQALNKLHNSERQSQGYFCFDKADILSNRYLCLRELSCFTEARMAKIEAAKLNYGRTKLSLP